MVIAPQLNLLITRAEVNRIEFNKCSWRAENQWIYSVSVMLFAGSQNVTSLTLSSDVEFDSIKYIEFDDETRKSLNNILTVISRNANISLARISRQIKEPVEVETIKEK
jgi:hypothetical protein